MTEAHSHAVSAGGRHKGRLYVVLALTGSYMFAEVIGGILTGSLALLADAGHMLTDVFGISMALIAIKLGERPASDRRTFGYYRTEVLAALTNAVILVVVAIYILYEAYRRFQDPPDVLGGWMMVVAVIGLAVNLVGMFILVKGAGESLNVKGAYLEVLGDTLGSIGVIVASLIIIFTGWYPADPIIGVGIGLFIIPRAYNLLKESVNVLLEGTPKDLDLGEVREALEKLPGVVRVHDLHAWTITSGMNAMSGHLVVEDMNRSSDILTGAQKLLHDRFDIEHSTIQIEPVDFEEPAETHR
ncbi:MAG: cation diffusion facilitator family transporter [Actinomycetota bacterium]|uniref:Cation efflux system protein n=1 Tax=Rubrobacter xylanophilus TaxID=49319 RepID=A0A510HGH7_9ACTN|nr:cation diffusion facilitator family transporter [Rubrobacter xylanophilus]QYJ14847.1 Metal cation efflux system protein CzcD [Rubrobacter xylanophilus DSM 9941]BBL79066.1 cation efflux system protein [Rubrobacter xylanophilus]